MIIGGGPTGLMLAAELALAGVDVAIVERRQPRISIRARARGLHPRTIEMLDQRGIAERFISRGTEARGLDVRVGACSSTDLPTRHNYVLGLMQKHIERILADWVAELAVPIYRGVEVVGFAQDEAGVDVELVRRPTRARGTSSGATAGAAWCARQRASTSRAGTRPTSWLIAEVQMAEEPPMASATTQRGQSRHRQASRTAARADIVLIGTAVGSAGEPTLADLSAALIPVYGTDFGVHSAASASRASPTRRGRPPTTARAACCSPATPPTSIRRSAGRVSTSGMQDAVNLGWKLAQVVKGSRRKRCSTPITPNDIPSRPASLRTSMALVALGRQDERTKALRETLADVLAMDEPSR